MKASNVSNYPLFIFKSDNLCIQTSDYNILKNIYNFDNKSVKSSFEIGNKLSVRMDDKSVRKFQIDNVSIKGVVENIEDNQLGTISDGCVETIGKDRDECLFLFIEMTEINP